MKNTDSLKVECRKCQSISQLIYDKNRAKDLYSYFPYKSGEIVLCEQCGGSNFILLTASKFASGEYSLMYNESPILVTDSNLYSVRSDINALEAKLTESILHAKYSAEMRQLEQNLIGNINGITQHNTDNIRKESVEVESKKGLGTSFLLWVFGFILFTYVLVAGISYRKDIVGYVIIGVFICGFCVVVFSKGLNSGIARLIILTILLLLSSVLFSFDDVSCWYRVGCM
ncbi:tripartite tricarboxylate transporter TctB family protein [Vibrio vulnificus]|nr:tripartite tricarboxylate transporter TctB family protein [Vibrio vulnificus]EIZ4670075.1 tripartite tricarboxylate transporter TctB family protein [Vibrio vulnificus]HAS8429925.1 tripartite tricarboxylate transporter TctB family protein [Vibrio vulnificus]HDY7692573.1 tripartite tricarboxylate transporter TctB family protein [Vibrio vulnificus]HDY7809457.1 tripartite tricarboxylate transporter TctB family protein [Vibrio vulnificus]